MKPENPPTTSQTDGPQLEPEELIRQAGAQPPLPELNFDTLAAPARVAWQATVDRRRARRRHRMVTLAASLILVFGSLWWLGRPAPIGVVTGHFVAGLESFQEDHKLLRPGQRIRTEAPERRLLVSLGDGHRLRLDVGSRLTLVSESEVLLERGALFVEAAPAPLTVATAQGRVQHIGTRYEVRITEDGLTRARVREGRVRVSRQDDSVEIGRGQGAEITARGTIETHRVEPYGNAWAWIDDAVPPFADAQPTLEELLSWASEETGYEWHAEPDLLVDSQGQPIRVHGIPRGKAPRESLEKALAAAGLRLQADNGRWLIQPSL